MNRILLKNIQSLKSTPSISLLMPTHRSFPDNQQDKIRLKNLANAAIDRLKKEFSNSDIKNILNKLNNLTDEIDINHLEDGLAVFFKQR